MLYRQGFTLVEIIVVLVIIGVMVAFISPNFNTPSEQARALNAQNNLLAIYSAQQNYNNNNNAYCTAACGSLASINTALSLNIQDDGTYTYSCTGLICKATRNVAASSPVLQMTLDAPVNINNANPSAGNPSCSAPVNSNWCP